MVGAPSSVSSAHLPWVFCSLFVPPGVMHGDGDGRGRRLGETSSSCGVPLFHLGAASSVWTPVAHLHQCPMTAAAIFAQWNCSSVLLNELWVSALLLLQFQGSSSTLRDSRILPEMGACYLGKGSHVLTSREQSHSALTPTISPSPLRFLFHLVPSF